MLLWLESKKKFISKIIPPVSSYASPISDISRKSLFNDGHNKNITKQDINDVKQLLRLIDQSKNITEDIITERENEISRQIMLREILLSEAELKNVSDMRTDTHTQVLTLHQLIGVSYLFGITFNETALSSLTFSDAFSSLHNKSYHQFLPCLSSTIKN